MLRIISKKAEHPRTATVSLTLPVARKLWGGGGRGKYCVKKKHYFVLCTLKVAKAGKIYHIFDL
jgi:hypothetical protein